LLINPNSDKIQNVIIDSESTTINSTNAKLSSTNVEIDSTSTKINATKFAVEGNGGEIITELKTVLQAIGAVVLPSGNTIDQETGGQVTLACTFLTEFIGA